jgi:uncharacterized protein (TIGR02996 family)
MSEEEIFLWDILTHPDDDVPWLIYSDWLEDHDDPRAAFVRAGYAARSAMPWNPIRRQFAGEVRLACEQNGWIEYDHLVLTPKQLVFLFRCRLADTIAFCGERPLPLRTWDLEPRTLVGYTATHGWPYADDIDWPSMTLQLSLVRRQRLEQIGKAPIKPANGLAGGRLLVFDPAASMSEGYSSQHSQGYFDADNIPPWDTWVMCMARYSAIYPHPYVICYAPAPHRTRAASGIEVNGEGCLLWIEDSGVTFLQDLRESGLFS